MIWIVCLQKLENIMFADDTNLFLVGNSIPDVERTINAELAIIAEWFQSNKLSPKYKKNFIHDFLVTKKI